MFLGLNSEFRGRHLVSSEGDHMLLEAMMRGDGMTPEMTKKFEKIMDGYHDLVESGRREVFKIEG